MTAAMTVMNLYDAIKASFTFAVPRAPDPPPNADYERLPVVRSSSAAERRLSI